jgi:hypothetical protein
MVGVVVAVVLLAGLRMTTVGGTATVKLLTALLQPPAVQATAVTLAGCPFTKVRLVQVQLPEPLATVMHVWPLGPCTVTLLPGVAVPEMGGLRLATVDPLAGLLITTVAAAIAVI